MNRLASLAVVVAITAGRSTAQAELWGWINARTGLGVVSQLVAPNAAGSADIVQVGSPPGVVTTMLTEQRAEGDRTWLSATARWVNPYINWSLPVHYSGGLASWPGGAAVGVHVPAFERRVIYVRAEIRPLSGGLTGGIDLTLWKDGYTTGPRVFEFHTSGVPSWGEGYAELENTTAWQQAYLLVGDLGVNGSATVTNSAIADALIHVEVIRCVGADAGSSCGAAAPSIAVAGDAVPGEELVLVVNALAPATSVCVMVGGSSPPYPIGTGCDLRIDPLNFSWAGVARLGLGGAGSPALRFVLPPGLPSGSTISFQAIAVNDNVLPSSMVMRMLPRVVRAGGPLPPIVASSIVGTTEGVVVTIP